MSAAPKLPESETASKTAPMRPISFGPMDVAIERRDDGTIYLRPTTPLSAYPVRLTDKLHHWAKAEPERVFIAERDASGGWRKVTYAQLLQSSRAIASALIARGLSAERPLVILSGNGISHALIATAALYVGVPYAPVSTAYSLVSSDFAKLKAPWSGDGAA